MVFKNQKYTLHPSWNLLLKVFACLALALMLARAVAFWAADPLLGYANNYDQQRVTRMFGLQPRDWDASRHIYWGTKGKYGDTLEMVIWDSSLQGVNFASTPDQPWRFYIQAAPMGMPRYPSSDLLFKAVQVGVMQALHGPGGALDIRIGGATVLIAWLAGVLWVFARLLARPAAALGFALWCAVLADPVNWLFLNTLYAEFSAFMAVTLLTGVLWLWLEKRLSGRWTLALGAALALLLTFNRIQYILIPLALTPIAAAIWWMEQKEKTGAVRPARAARFAAILAVICVLPFAQFLEPSHQTDVRFFTFVNRVDTVMGALLPASQNPEAMLRTLGLPPQCMALSGKNWYENRFTIAEYKKRCPQLLTMSSTGTALAVLAEPAVLGRLVENITTRFPGFLQGFLGHVEGRRFASIADSGFWTRTSIDSAIQQIAPVWKERLIWLLVFVPFALAVALWAARARRWALMFATQGLLFSYCLFSSILGDGYYELQRHTMLCLSFGVLFPILLLTGGLRAATAFVQRADYSPRLRRLNMPQPVAL